MTNVFRDVLEFATVAESPNYKRDGEQFLTLARKLVVEEVDNEFLPAFDKWRQNRSLENLCDAVDGALDSIYVLTFFLVQMGFPSEEFWKKLQRYNMAKFPDGVAIKDPVTGKVQKPPGWTPPNWMMEMIDWNTQMGSERYRAGILQSTPLNMTDPTTGADAFPGVPASELPVCPHCGQRGMGHITGLGDKGGCPTLAKNRDAEQAQPKE